jgi:tellurite methyltransferase
MEGGYEDSYRSCSCFWGTNPVSLVLRLREHIGDMAGLRVLDAGCGEGKNAAFFAAHGAIVDAFNVSERALQNAARSWPQAKNIRWNLADVRYCSIPRSRTT